MIALRSKIALKHFLSSLFWGHKVPVSVRRIKLCNYSSNNQIVTVPYRAKFALPGRFISDWLAQSLFPEQLTKSSSSRNYLSEYKCRHEIPLTSLIFFNPAKYSEVITKQCQMWMKISQHNGMLMKTCNLSPRVSLLPRFPRSLCWDTHHSASALPLDEAFPRNHHTETSNFN